jgi:biopolymer transport protein TolR
MGMAMGGQGGPKSDINVTPMIDILLVLIIIFMVITPLTPKGLDAMVPQPPKDNQPNDADNRTVVINIDDQKKFSINSEEVPENLLGEKLFDIFKTRAERICFVKGAPDIDFSYVAKAIDIAKGANVDKVGLMTKAVEAGQ